LNRLAAPDLAELEVAKPTQNSAERNRHVGEYTESAEQCHDRIKNHLDRVVRGSVEETLNALLDAEADRLCNARRYERSEARRDTRAGHYERKLHTKAGEVRLKVPKLRQQTFETAIIERRRESSVEEALSTLRSSPGSAGEAAIV
jgi:transposase-like protein